MIYGKLNENEVDCRVHNFRSHNIRCQIVDTNPWVISTQKSAHTILRSTRTTLVDTVFDLGFRVVDHLACLHGGSRR